jgi:putative glutamine amidotransferase
MNIYMNICMIDFCLNDNRQIEIPYTDETGNSHNRIRQSTINQHSTNNQPTINQQSNNSQRGGHIMTQSIFKSITRISIFLLIIVLFIPVNAKPPTAGTPGNENSDVVFAMCCPTKKQIRNIVEMYEKDIITPQRIKLIGVYHENEFIDYSKAHQYVEENELFWVSFKIIKGLVPRDKIYKNNIWTPQFKEIFNQTDGILFTGGWDIPPELYGEDNLLLTEANTPIRSYYESSFLFHLLGSSRNKQFTPFLESRKDYTVMGICLGAQTMNIACGGTMIQDIPQEVYKLDTVTQVLKKNPDAIHSARYLDGLHPLEKDVLPPAFHRIKIKKNSIFTKEMGMKKKDNPFVLTSHHQAIEKLGKNLNVIATSMDGKIIEAIQHSKYKNVLGVQFHPEPYILYMKGKFYKKSPGAPLNFNLKQFLQSNPPSMQFHKKIWQWFSDTLVR